jgi:hypothetical protein
LYYCRHDGIPCHENTIKWHLKWYTFLHLLQEHSHLSPPQKKRHTFSMLIWYCTWCPAPGAACNWSHLAVGTRDAHGSLKPTHNCGSTSISTIPFWQAIFLSKQNSH